MKEADMSNKKEKPQPNGALPNQLINQLIEHTVGGFILFYFNQETGEPEQVITFDSPAHSLALQKYISDWQDAVEQVNFNNSVNAIQQGIQSISDDNEEGEEGENGDPKK